MTRADLNVYRKVRDREDALAGTRNACATGIGRSTQDRISWINHAVFDNGVDIGSMRDVVHWI